MNSENNPLGLTSGQSADRQLSVSMLGEGHPDIVAADAQHVGLGVHPSAVTKELVGLSHNPDTDEPNRDFVNVWGSDETRAVDPTALSNLCEGMVEDPRRQQIRDFINTKVPDHSVLTILYPVIEIKDGKPYTPDGERWRLQAGPIPDNEQMAAAWKVLLGTIKAVGRHNGELNNEDVLTVSWVYCPNPLSEEYPTGVVPYWTVRDGLGATDRLFAFYFDIAESGTTPENPKTMSATLSFDRDGKDVISIEHDFPGLKSVVFYLPILGDAVPDDPEDLVKPSTAFECQPNLMVVAR